MKFQLYVLSGDHKGQSFDLSKTDKQVIGRDNSCDFPLVDAGISRKHCCVWQQEGAIWVEDMGSSNGTLVNQNKLASQRKLVLEDIIQLGQVQLQLQKSARKKSAYYRKLRAEPTFSPELTDTSAIQRNLLLLHNVGKLIHNQHKEDELMGELLELLIPAFFMERGCGIIKPALLEKNITIYRTYSKKQFLAKEFLLNVAVLNNALNTGEGTLCENSQENELLSFHSTTENGQIKSILCVPIEGQLNTLGAIYLDSVNQSQSFDNQELDILTAIGRQIGLAIERLLLQKQLEASVKHYQTIYQSMIEKSKDAIYRRRLDGSFLVISPSIEGLLGISCKEFLNNFSLWEQQVHPDDKKIVWEKQKKLLANEQCDFKYKMLTVNNKIIWVEETCYPIQDDEGNIICIQGVLKDITQTYLLEKQLKRREHLALLGEFSAGVAHEIRNPLSAMEGYAGMLKRKLEAPAKLELMDILISEIHYLNEIVGQILAYARELSCTPKPTPIISFLQEILTTAIDQKDLQKIKLDLRLSPDVPILQIDPHEMKKVLINLIQNAVQAMQKTEKKELVIETYKNEIEQGLTVMDSGQGMSEELWKEGKIFQPFFTTNKEGTGLGLSIAHKIVEAHNAFFRINSQPTLGTKITIVFPQETS